MAFEPTSPENKHQLTKKQHFHMRAILQRFTNSANRVEVTEKSSGAVSYLGVNNQKFMGKRAWSQEVEAGISGPIETEFLREVDRVESGGAIENHGAISDYHLLWTLRHHFALNPLDEAEVIPGMQLHMDVELEELVEAMHKLPVRDGGKIAGRFATTLAIKELLADPNNVANYDGIYWNVIRSGDKKFISADQYSSQLLLVVNPFLLLQGCREVKSSHTASSEEVEIYNQASIKQAQHFTFGSPSS